MLVRQGQHRGHVIFHVPSFVPEEQLLTPEGATHFKLFAHIIALSDYQFDEEKQQYVQQEANGYGLSNYVESPLSPVLRIPLDPMTFHTSLQPESPFTDGTSFILSVGVQFFQFRHTEYKLLEQGNSMEIYQVH